MNQFGEGKWKVEYIMQIAVGWGGWLRVLSVCTENPPILRVFSVRTKDPQCKYFLYCPEKAQRLRVQHKSGCDGRMVSALDYPNHKIVGLSPAEATAQQNPSRVGYGWRQWCLGSLSRKWVPGDRQRWQLYLYYPWRLDACKPVYAPQGVEQVTDVTGLSGVIICKGRWASFGKKKRYI